MKLSFVFTAIFAIVCIPLLGRSETVQLAQTPSSFIGLQRSNGEFPSGIHDVGRGWLFDESWRNLSLEDFPSTTYAVTVVQEGNQQMLWLELWDGMGTSNITIEILDVLNIPTISDSNLLLHGECDLNGTQDPELIAIARYADAAYLTQLSHAWRANFSTGRFEEISTQGVQCFNQALD